MAKTTTSYLAAGVPASHNRGGVASASFDWHADGMPRSLTWRKGTGGAIVRAHTNLAYDQGGMRTVEDVSVLQPGALTATGGWATYAYDLAERLTGWTSPFIDLGAGDRLRSAYVLDDGEPPWVPGADCEIGITWSKRCEDVAPERR